MAYGRGLEAAPRVPKTMESPNPYLIVRGSMLAVLLAAAGVFGAPTSSTQAARPIGPATTPQHAIACTFYNPAPPCTVDNGESLPLTQLGHHLFDPHAITWAQSSQPTPNAIRSLPALPGAILLALMGFACVLFANNRGRLIAVFGTLLVLSHAGLRLLPEITARYLSSRANRTHNAPAALVPPTNALLPTQAHQPVQYAGLLHRLAGSPDPAAPIVEHLSRPTRVDWLTLSQHAKAAALR